MLLLFPNKALTIKPNDMKKMLKEIMAIIAMVVIAGTADAQNNAGSKTPEWVSEKGYWVVQSNRNNPLEHTVFFYDKENNLVSVQAFKGEKLDPTKKKTKNKLRKALEAALSSLQSMGEADQPLYFAWN
jgi:hypothetical protein